ncbi:hypothetical protein CAPTEDRAFT_209768, partial [Capitella teleta]
MDMLLYSSFPYGPARRDRVLLGIALLNLPPGRSSEEGAMQKLHIEQKRSNVPRGPPFCPLPSDQGLGRSLAGRIQNVDILAGWWLHGKRQMPLVANRTSLVRHEVLLPRSADPSPNNTLMGPAPFKEVRRNMIRQGLLMDTVTRRSRFRKLTDISTFERENIDLDRLDNTPTQPRKGVMSNPSDKHLEFPWRPPKSALTVISKTNSLAVICSGNIDAKDERRRKDKGSHLFTSRRKGNKAKHTDT